MTTLTLPFPPSTNNLFKNISKGRARSDRYNAWLKEGWAMIVQQRPARVAGPFRLTLVATRPDRRARDLDNLAKPCLDLLVKAGVIRDDSDASSILLMWAPEPPMTGATVRLTVVDDALAALSETVAA